MFEHLNQFHIEQEWHTCTTIFRSNEKLPSEEKEEQKRSSKIM